MRASIRHCKESCTETQKERKGADEERILIFRLRKEKKGKEKRKSADHL